MNIKILTAYHKRSELISSDIIKPIQVGADVTACINPAHLHDNTGDNISAKNEMYCELTAQYWAWKNLDADYYGFMHYRRYFAFGDSALKRNYPGNIELPYPDNSAIEKLHLSDKEIEDTVINYDVVTVEPCEMRRTEYKTVYGHYASNHMVEDLDLVLDIISEKYPEYRASADKYINGHKLHYGNMFIMKKELFFDYCRWLFDILAEHEKRGDFRDYSLHQYRVSGFLAERLWGIYLTWLKENKNPKVLEVPICFFENTEENTPVKPAFAEDSVPVVFAANDSYVPYLAVALKSLIDNTSRERNYDIIVLHNDITEENQARLTRELVQAENISLRFKDVTPIFAKYKDYNLRVFDQISVETYFRFFIQDIMPDYDKIVYLDSDLTLLADVAELYDTPLGDCILAAVRDTDSAGSFNSESKDYKLYQLNQLKLENPYDYFNAGVLVINLAEMRKCFSVDDTMRFAASGKWRFLDQDILNMLCAGRVKFLDMSWNVMMDWKVASDSRMNLMKRAPRRIYLDYMQSRNAPKIVHYAGFQKPWKYPDCDFARYFWQYARKTSFYEALVACSGVKGGQGQTMGGYGNNLECNLSIVGVNEPVYSNGLYVKFINSLNALLPKGTRRRELVKKIAGVFIK